MALAYERMYWLVKRKQQTKSITPYAYLTLYSHDSWTQLGNMDPLFASQFAAPSILIFAHRETL